MESSRIINKYLLFFVSGMYIFTSHTGIISDNVSDYTVMVTVIHYTFNEKNHFDSLLKCM